MNYEADKRVSALRRITTVMLEQAQWFEGEARADGNKEMLSYWLGNKNACTLFLKQLGTNQARVQGPNLGDGSMSKNQPRLLLNIAPDTAAWNRRALEMARKHDAPTDDVFPALQVRLLKRIEMDAYRAQWRRLVRWLAWGVVGLAVAGLWLAVGWGMGVAW